LNHFARSDADLRSLITTLPREDMNREAARLRDIGHGDIVTYSRKVFIPLTRLCRDVCYYCTFAQSPRQAAASFKPPGAAACFPCGGGPISRWLCSDCQRAKASRKRMELR